MEKTLNYSKFFGFKIIRIKGMHGLKCTDNYIEIDHFNFNIRCVILLLRIVSVDFGPRSDPVFHSLHMPRGLIQKIKVYCERFPSVLKRPCVVQKDVVFMAAGE